MPWSERKTWSQQTLAVARRAAGLAESSRGSGFLTQEKRTMLLLAAKTTAAAGICYGLATLAGLTDGYWGSISSIIVMQSNVGSTVTASRDRLIGTLIGAAFGAAFSWIDPALSPLAVYLAAVILAMVTCGLLGLKNSSRLAGVTVTVILLVHRTGSNWTVPLHRVLEVLLGIVVALAISTFVLPARARLRLRDGLAQEFLLLGALFAAVLEGSRGAAKPAAGLWKQVEDAIAANAQLLDAARHEPAGGKASLEALSLLHQFGGQLLSLLRALDLSASSSCGDGYAVQLEPELGALAAGIETGFRSLGGCIHRWQFDPPPEGLELEDSIAALETRMAAIRPTGLAFPQDEILRAYAVQLHLKQLARLLRASRLETARMAA